MRRRRHQLSLDHGRGAGRKLGEVFGAGRAGVHDHLQVGEAGAVVQFEEREALGVAPGADPALDRDGVLRFRGRQDVFNQCAHTNRYLNILAPAPGRDEKMVACLPVCFS